jgi:cyclophilin family peptidyl-prolyl cis-trans isomerase
VVLVAVGGLILAVVLAVGFMFGSRDDQDATQTAQTDESAIPTLDISSISDSSEDEAASDEAGTEPTSEPPEASVPEDMPQYDAPDDMGLDAETTAYFATIDTDRGPIVVELWPDLAPEHVNSFVFLAKEGFYDGLTFHRVEPGFVIQGGDPKGDGTGGPGYSVPGEFNEDDPVPHRIGTFAMARSVDPHSAGSQFYIVLEDGASASSLDGKYTVFGHVISGMDVVQSIAIGDVMNSVTIQEKPIEERVVSPDDIREGNLPDNA